MDMIKQIKCESVEIIFEAQIIIIIIFFLKRGKCIYFICLTFILPGCPLRLGVLW